MKLLPSDQRHCCLCRLLDVPYFIHLCGEWTRKPLLQLLFLLVLCSLCVQLLAVDVLLEFVVIVLLCNYIYVSLDFYCDCIVSRSDFEISFIMIIQLDSFLIFSFN